MSRRCSAPWVVACLLAPGSAVAQVRGYSADRLIVAPAPDDGVAVMRPLPSERASTFGHVTFDYLHRPLHTGPITDKVEVKKAYSTGIISDQAYAYATVGGQVLSRLVVSLTLPISLVDRSHDPGPALPSLSGGSLQTKDENLGDARLDARARLLTTDDARLSVALAATVFAPTGSDTDFTGDGATHAAFQALAERRFGELSLAAFAGVHLRPAKTIGEPASRAALRFGNEALFGVGAFVPASIKVDLGLEIFGQTGISTITLPDGSTRSTFFRTFDASPAEWLAHARVSLGHGTWLRLGTGTVLIPGYSAPDLRILAQIGCAQ